MRALSTLDRACHMHLHMFLWRHPYTYVDLASPWNHLPGVEMTSVHQHNQFYTLLGLEPEALHTPDKYSTLSYIPELVMFFDT